MNPLIWQAGIIAFFAGAAVIAGLSLRGRQPDEIQYVANQAPPALSEVRRCSGRA